MGASRIEAPVYPSHRIFFPRNPLKPNPLAPVTTPDAAHLRSILESGNLTMSSLRRIESSRANGARSHGPVTDAGKQVSSQNALRHAPLARIVVLKNESSSGFAEVLDEHLVRFRPADAVEFAVVEEMV